MFEHIHYALRTHQPSYYHYELEPHEASPTNVAVFRIPSSDDPLVTALPPSIHTAEGRRVCQQIYKDMTAFWEGKPVEYLALYIRDW